MRCLSFVFPLRDVATAVRACVSGFDKRRRRLLRLRAIYATIFLGISFAYDGPRTFSRNASTIKFKLIII